MRDLQAKSVTETPEQLTDRPPPPPIPHGMGGSRPTTIGFLFSCLVKGFTYPFKNPL